MATLRLNAPIDDAELQMRRALRVGSPSQNGSNRDQAPDNRGTRRFSQAGDVPVTRLAARKDHPANLALGVAEDALQAERAAREQIEQALAQANATIVTLQTKLAHAEMAHAEALAGERAARAEITQLAELLSESNVAPVVAAPPADLVQPLYSLEAEAEQEPVQWWVPGWKGVYRRG